MQRRPPVNVYESCRLCPRACGVNRRAGERGFCGEGAELRLACAGLHRGEEPPLAGGSGSGVIFVSGCNLRCVFCQNYQISHQGMGAPPPDFAGLCLLLQERGAANINIVTGSHAVPTLAAGITAARARGLRLPVLWNSSAYESPAALKMLDGLVNIYLPDLKTLNRETARQLFNAPDYPERATEAILCMAHAAPLCQKPDGPLYSGVLVRHLVLPGLLADTRAVLEWFAAHLKGRALLSLMTQYTPLAAPSPAPARFISTAEYQQTLDWLDELGLEDGYYQELETGADWLPDFSRAQPFPGGLATSLWHWREGLQAQKAQ